MITRTLKNIELFRLNGEGSGLDFYGSNQDWYKKRWQRMSGCGPSAVANIIYYLDRTRGGHECCPNLAQSEYLELMNDIWNYVTPSLGGISSTAMLLRGAEKYLVAKELKIKMNYIDIPKKKALRPDFQKVLTFVDQAIQSDSPVAFLNLEHGSLRELESWHWVTIISLEYEPEGNAAYVQVLDGGLIKRLNLLEWFRTTRLGGGFVSFEAWHESE